MNRLEMQEIIKESVPYLIEQHQEEWKEYEKQRQKFVRDYSIDRIRNLTLDDYVTGKGSDNRSFCYRIEYDLAKLGVISGTPAKQYGVWFGKDGQETDPTYRNTARYGDNIEIAFKNVKLAIVNLLQNAEDLANLQGNILPPMFKGKILFLYHPEKFLNIYSNRHLSFFAAHLNINTSADSELYLQKALMDYKATWPELKNASPFLYGALLYDLFGRPPKEKTKQMPLLSTAIKGAKIALSENGKTSGKSQSPDYEELQRNRKITGDRGEKIVLEIEIKRLKDAGEYDLAEKVLHVADTDDTKGFDILSFDEDGTERQIEVKSTSMNSFYKGFFLSANELEKSNTLSNYYLYLVSSAMSEKPVIEIKRNPVFTDINGYELIPNQYNVRLR